jgi:hypothetical protein
MFSYQQAAHHNHHGGRRRQPRQQLSAKNNQQFLRQQPPRTPVVEQPTLSHLTYKRELEASISFDEESDLIFCPFHLLTEDDVRPSPGSFRNPQMLTDRLASINTLWFGQVELILG